MRPPPRWLTVFSLAVWLASALCSAARADGPSTGPSGINSQGLGLTGNKIGIGQVERERPGLPGYDSAANVNSTVTPKDVFFRNAKAPKDQLTGDHPERVAGIMISNHAVHKSVAPGASLYSAAYGPTAPTFEQNYGNILLSMQQVALQNKNAIDPGGDVRAINLSFGTGLHPQALHNGSALVSMGLDWSARQHDALYVVAGNEKGSGLSRLVPQDSFNSIHVGFTKPVLGTFQRVNENSVFNTSDDGRRLTDIVAPGTGITSTIRAGADPKADPRFAAGSGTSFAAPHVTGTIALLQEFADLQIAAKEARWDGDARRHQVMKAVLMNSADKIEDTGDGLLLGMEKTIFNTKGKTWLDSDAYKDKGIPLDKEIGAGQLNAKRALTQFQTGEWDSIGSAIVPTIGWDFGTTLKNGDINKYVFDEMLIKDSFIAITLAWDRDVDLIDDLKDPKKTKGMFDLGESFNYTRLTDLDLYLLPKGAKSTDEAIWSSESQAYNVEHIFFQIPKTGAYEFWVHQRQVFPGGASQIQDYAVAWWAVPVPEPSSIVLLGVGVSCLVAVRRRHRRGAFSGEPQATAPARSPAAPR